MSSSAPGRIRVLVNGRLRRQPFLDIRKLVGSSYVEQGLLSVAFHPDYARNHRFYVYYTDRNGDINVVEYRSNGARALLRTRRRLLFVDHPSQPNHDGGQLQFGPDGLLYAGTGDGGGAGDPFRNGQSLRTRLAKLLRLDVNKRGATWQIAAYGLRNPWRFSWDPGTHDLYIGDVGQSAWEEVDFRPSAGQGQLTNYGWSRYEGFETYNGGALNPTGELVRPLVVYAHTAGRCSITGGYVYRGASVPAARGRYFYGDYCSGDVWSLTVANGKASVRHEPANVPRLSSFGVDARGELYAASLSGSIYRLTR